MSPSLARIVLPLALTLAACADDGLEHLEITTIQVTGEVDFGALEVEVHLFDAVDLTHLGCAGQDDGLEQVDDSDVRYQLVARFQDPRDGSEVDALDLAGRAIEVQVIEDDTDRCPTPPGPDDDVIGIATGLDFRAGQTVAFDNVTALRIAIE